MKAFEYVGATSVDQALKALAPGSAAMAGGTDLMNRMKDYVTSPDRVVYLNDVKELAGISGDSTSGVTILAGTRLADHERSGHPPDSQHGQCRRESHAASSLLVLPFRIWPAA